MTYQELLERANGLANVLRDRGVQRGDRVGVYLKKSLETAIAIYSIWKAGAAYVPLDPNAPLARLRAIIENCEIRHLISSEQKTESLLDLAQHPLLNTILGSQQPETANAAADFVAWSEIDSLKTTRNPDAPLNENDLAYVMYTSGSTGEPKGIMHTHRSGLSYAQLAVNTYEVGPQDRLGNHAPLHFDQSTMEYFAGPLAGATTIIIPEMYTRLPASLSQLIERERMTIWYSVPFALIQLLLRGVLEQRDLSSLRWVLFGGEVFPRKYLDDLMKRLPQATFSNVYGPAEVNQCSYFNLTHQSMGSLTDDEEIPIGKIWDETVGLIVDENDNEVAEGEAGELLIASSTMMQGYWRQPDLNDQVFCKKQSSDDQLIVFYRTGDLVVQKPDGNLVFLGRKDRQVKVRGYRVELDEVESVIASHDDVEEVAAVGLTLKDDQLHVVAMVLLKPEGTITAEQVRSFAATRLPGYAVPENILVTDHLPRTATDKIDRMAVKELVAEGLVSREKPE